MDRQRLPPTNFSTISSSSAKFTPVAAMIPTVLFKRQLIVTAIVALGAALVIYFSHTIFSISTQPTRTADAIGAIALVFCAFFAQHLVSHLSTATLRSDSNAHSPRVNP